MRDVYNDGGEVLINKVSNDLHKIASCRSIFDLKKLKNKISKTKFEN